MKKAVIKKFTAAVLLIVLVACCAFALCACDKDGGESPNTTYFENDVRFGLNVSNTQVMNFGNPYIMMVRNAFFDNANTYAEFKADGTMHCQIQTKAELFSDVNKLLDSIKTIAPDFDVEQILASVELSGMFNDYVEPMFPGFTEYFKAGDVRSALGLIKRSLGFDITGLDTEDPEIKALFKEIGRTLALPEDLLERIPADAVLTLSFDSTYCVKELIGHDGEKHTGIYVSAIAQNGNTQPYCVFTLTQNEKGGRELFFRAEFMMTQIGLTERV